MSAPDVNKLNEAAAAALVIAKNLPMVEDERAACHDQISQALHDCANSLAREQHDARKAEIVSEGITQIRVSLVASATTSARSVRIRVGRLTKGARDNPGLSYLRFRLDNLEGSILTAGADVENGSRSLNEAFAPVARECSGVDAIVTGMEENRKEKKGWGNPRHYIVGGIIGLASGLALLPVTHWYERTQLPQNPPAIEEPTQTAAPIQKDEATMTAPDHEDSKAP